MRSYRFAAHNQDEEVYGVIQAESRYAAYAEIAKKHGTVDSLERAGWSWQRITLTDLALWMRQMATMLEAGLTLKHALEITSRGENERLNEVLEHLLHDIRTGHTLSVAFSRHPTVFAPELVSTLWAGEEAGRLPAVLSRVADEMERAARLRSVLMAQLTYPICVVSLASLLMLGFFLGIMPALAAVFKNLGVSLPWLTRGFILISDVLTNFYVAGPLLLAGLGGAWLVARRGSRLFWTVGLRLPGLGPLLQTVTEIRMLTTLALMLQSGLHLGRALPVMAGISPDPRARRAWLKVQQGVLEGKTLPAEIAAAGLFGKTIRALLVVGEEGGELVKLMQWGADLLDQELSFKLQRLVSLVEPLTVGALGGVAAVAVLAAFLPLIELIRAFM